MADNGKDLDLTRALDTAYGTLRQRVEDSLEDLADAAARLRRLQTEERIQKNVRTMISDACANAENAHKVLDALVKEHLKDAQPPDEEMIPAEGAR